MITKVTIKDNTNTPLGYLSKLPNFKNGATWEFKPGVNIIIGENGSGKSTLLKLIQNYLLLDYTECDKGIYNHNINTLFQGFGSTSELLDGVDVYADYTKNTFRLSHAGERAKDQALETFEHFGIHYEQRHSSTGEGVVIAMQSLFQYMFSNKARLMFDYAQFEKTYPAYYQYTQEHKVECADAWTIIMDEPDRNLSLKYLKDLKEVLSFHKPNTQLIVVIHNPLLILTLMKDESINFIEMSANYLQALQEWNLIFSFNATKPLNVILCNCIRFSSLLAGCTVFY